MFGIALPLRNAVKNFFAWTEGRYPPSREVTSPNRLIVSFHIQWQEMTNWCWSAVASSISYHFDENSTWDQVEIVATTFRYDEQAMPDESWNRASQIEIGLNIVCCLSRVINDKISFGDVFRELKGNRPVCVQINWDKNNAHAVVINGCWLDDQSNAYYRVSDPYHIVDCLDFPPQRDISEKQLQKYLDEGTWTRSFLVCAA